MTVVELPALPALVVGRVAHTRRMPVHHSFTHRAFQWLIDIDEPPRLPWGLGLLAGFRAVDHLDGGSSGGGIRGGVAAFLAGHGIPLNPADRVLMLANARMFGHVVNPLTVFWVLDPSRRVRAVVFEVHNTYRQRHVYLLDVDEDGHARTEKAFYVSPFNDTSGRYQVRLHLAAELVRVSVGLERAGERIMTAVSSGAPEPATPGSVLRVSARHLFMTHRVTALIRWHGIRLWLRRLPIAPRPTHSQEISS